MTRTAWRRTASAVMTLGMLASAGMAEAGRTQIDGSDSPITTICSISSPSACSTPTTLKGDFASSTLVANFGFGPFSSVYIYNNGLVSIGAAITPGANLSSLATIGGNVFTAGYSSSMTISNFTIQGPQPSQFDNFLQPVVRVNYDTAFTTDRGAATQKMGFSIYDLGGGAYELALQHGVAGIAPDFPVNGYLGYSFGGSGVLVGGTTAQTQVRADTDYRYVFRVGTPGGVPEPATWAMLMFGFGAMGAALRRPRRGFAALG